MFKLMVRLKPACIIYTCQRESVSFLGLAVSSIIGHVLVTGISRKVGNYEQDFHSIKKEVAMCLHLLYLRRGQPPYNDHVVMVSQSEMYLMETMSL